MAAMLIVVGLVASASAAAPSRPHIIIALADDFGWHNIGWRNPEIASPTLNRLAKDGIILDRHYTVRLLTPLPAPLGVVQWRLCDPFHARHAVIVGIGSCGSDLLDRSRHWKPASRLSEMRG